MEQPIFSVRCFEKLYRRGEVRIYNDRVERSLEPLLFGKRRLSMRIESVPFRLAAYVEAKRHGYWLTSVNLMCGGMSFSYLCFRRDAEHLRVALQRQLAIAGQGMAGEVEDLDDQLTEQDHAMMRAFEREIVAAHDKNHAKHGAIDAGSMQRELAPAEQLTDHVLPGWQPDPLHSHSVRYHDGQQWTDFVHDYADANGFAGGPGIDPLADLPAASHVPSARPGSKQHDDPERADLRHEHLPNVVDLRRHRG